MFGWLKKTIARRASADDSGTAAAAHADTFGESAQHRARGDQSLAAGAADEAARHFRAALAIEPDAAQTHRLLGDALRSQGKLGEAALSYRQALALEPNLAQAHYGLGVTLLEQADFNNAAGYFRNALMRKADFAEAYNGLGFTLLELGQSAQALACFQKSLSLDPDNGMALHLAASLTGSNPESPPRQYIEKLFDGFAGDFDDKLQQLDYDTPQRLAALIQPLRPQTGARWNVLDLGCGTGLVGVQLASCATQLVGIDLSTKMLEKARTRQLYHRLLAGDLTRVMQSEPAASFDLVTAADTFIYVGKLDAVFREVKRLLAAGGLFAFSAEALEALPDAPSGASPTDDYRLQPAPSCRYAHARHYLYRLAAGHELTVRHCAQAHLRKSEGLSVSGYLVIMENTRSTRAA